MRSVLIFYSKLFHFPKCQTSIKSPLVYKKWGWMRWKQPAAVCLQVWRLSVIFLHGTLLKLFSDRSRCFHPNQFPKNQCIKICSDTRHNKMTSSTEDPSEHFTCSHQSDFSVSVLGDHTHHPIVAVIKWPLLTLYVFNHGVASKVLSCLLQHS